MIILLLKYLRNTYLRLSQTHRVAKDTTQMRSAVRIWCPRSAQRQEKRSEPASCPLKRRN